MDYACTGMILFPARALPRTLRSNLFCLFSNEMSGGTYERKNERVGIKSGQMAASPLRIQRYSRDAYY